jgi:UDPglucose--hexose-1-phosphate uridylyltransferase
VFDFNIPHRRMNPLTGEWVLVSPHRSQRPWLGQVEKIPPENLPHYDPDCYLCPGNSRAGGHINPVYQKTFVFDNDFPALLRPTGSAEIGAQNLVDSVEDGRLFRALPESGICRVVCFSPRHDLTFPELPKSQAAEVVETWVYETRSLETVEDICYVQVFENKGALMGCSNPHPHSQIWATSLIPNEPVKERIAQEEYLTRMDSCLLCDYLAVELGQNQRIIYSNDHFTALVPFWAVWPFEILFMSNRHTASLLDLDFSEVQALAEVLQHVTTKFDNLFEISFPYSMGFHQRPNDGKSHPGWHLHGHFYPPLLRSATVKKFMVGYEMLAMPQRDLTPESAAQKLRSLSPVHYKVMDSAA